MRANGRSYTITNAVVMPSHRLTFGCCLTFSFWSSSRLCGTIDLDLACVRNTFSWHGPNLHLQYIFSVSTTDAWLEGLNFAAESKPQPRFAGCAARE